MWSNEPRALRYPRTSNSVLDDVIGDELVRYISRVQPISAPCISAPARLRSPGERAHTKRTIRPARCNYTS